MRMRVDSLQIPKEIDFLLESGIWPRKVSQLQSQVTDPKITEDLVKKISPGHSVIYFDTPPFKTIEQLIKDGDVFWMDEMLSSIDYQRAVLIGDFGIETDTAIILYYEFDETTPIIMKLEWYGEKGSNIIDKARWVKVSDTFKEFCQLLNLKIPN